VIPSERYEPGRERPSYREIRKKLMAAIALVEQGTWRPVEPEKVEDDFQELEKKLGIEIALADDRAIILLTALKEVTPKDYIGHTPPEPSTHSVTRNLDLWEFRWESPNEFFKKSVMYLKFCIVGVGERGPAYIHSIHLDHPPSHEKGE
jgi:hypothetical protein